MSEVILDQLPITSRLFTRFHAFLFLYLGHIYFNVLINHGGGLIWWALMFNHVGYKTVTY